jgi:hypothetical protein
MIEAKILIKHLQNWAIPLKKWISWGVVGTSMFTKASTFLGSMILPFLDIMKPKMVPKNTMNAHFYGFKLIPNFLHFKKQFFNFSR